MGSTIRSLTIAARLDTAGFESGIQKSIAETRRFAAEVRETSTNLRRYQTALNRRGDDLKPDARAALEAKVRAAEERKASLAEAQAGRQALQERLAQAKAARAAEIAEHRQAASERRAIADRMYAATHTSQEVELRTLRRFYAEQRLMHRGNAQMMAQLDRAYAAERQAILTRSGGVVAGPAGVMAGGTRAMIGMNVRYGASMALGSAGGQMGSIASQALLPGMGAMAAATAGVALLVAGYREAARAAEQLAEAQKRHAALVRESEQWMHRMSELPTTDLGRDLSERTDSLREQISKSRERTSDLVKARDAWGGFKNPLTNAWAGVQILATGSSDRDREINASRAETQALQQEEARRYRVKVDELNAYRKQRAEDRAAEVTAARYAAMEDSADKRQLLLLHRQDEERRRFNAEGLEKLRRAAQDTTPAGQARATALREELEADAQAILERQRYEREGLAREEQQRRKEIADQEQQLRDQLTVAQGGSALEAQVAARRRELQDRKATADEIQRQLDLVRQLHQAQLQNDLVRQMAEYMIQVELATGKIDEMTAAMKRFRAANPDADAATEAKASAAAIWQENAKLAEWAKQQKDALKSQVDQFKEYRDKLKEARQAGYLSRSEETDLLKKKRDEMVGQRPEENIITRGTFSSQRLSDLSIGGASKLDRVAVAAEKTAALLDKLIAEVRDGAAAFN